MAKENHELPSRHKVSMKKEKKKENQKGRQRATFLYLAALAYAFSRAKCKQRKSTVNSANEEKTAQIKRKQCKPKANSANQMQTMQIKYIQRKSNGTVLPLAKISDRMMQPPRRFQRWPGGTLFRLLCMAAAWFRNKDYCGFTPVAVYRS